MSIACICNTVMLFIESFFDIRKRTIPTWFFIVWGVLVVIMQWVEKKPISWNMFLGSLLGVAMLLISFVSKEAIGYGDGWSFVILGWYFGGLATMIILFYSFLFSTITAIVLVILKKAKRKSSFPFIPCITMGYLVFCCTVA